MKKTTALAALLLGAMAAPAHAGADNPWQVKLLGTAVLPDGKIDRVDTDIVGLPATLQTAANDNYVPTLAVEYFFTDNVSVETICCITQHDVDATTGLLGAELVADAKVIPATVTLKYHLPVGAVKPYVGVGPTWFLWVDSKPGAATVPLGVTRTTLSSEVGVAVQAGVDVALGYSGFGLSLDAKRYFVNTTARWYAGQTLAIQTKHSLDPWVLSAGIAKRF
ncbi:outer membrane protein [Novosphingobium kunmingense]|uniref:Outer membrane protein n=1 Tax=Novosphingobium kunmingense TaxID=1211806 RepID=A0A2N0I2Y2_9SPHN|nr:OmpW family outer membrane protein [Novosphingobium kunmingense]PKB25510.1 outer membrane protein [Novosphingobium kunmingense]